MEENTRILILNNYVEMLKRKDIAGINDFMNNPKAMASFLVALGTSQEMMNLPAHRATLESCLKSMVSSTLSAVQDGETGLEVKYLEHGMEIHTESFSHEEKCTLEFSEDSYTFNVTRNIGEIKRKVKGSVEKRIIAEFKENFGSFNIRENSKELLNKRVDENGFIISETIKSTDKSKNKAIKRDGMKNFVDENKKGIAWNGNPSELNEKSESAKEFQKNMCHVIAKYPETSEYYESMVGKDVVDKAVKMLKSREDNS